MKGETYTRHTHCPLTSTHVSSGHTCVHTHIHKVNKCKRREKSYLNCTRAPFLVRIPLNILIQQLLTWYLCRLRYKNNLEIFRTWPGIITQQSSICLECVRPWLSPWQRETGRKGRVSQGDMMVDGHLGRNQSLMVLEGALRPAFSSVLSPPCPPPSAAQVEMATSMTSPWAASFEMPSCTRLELGPVR